MAKKHKKNIESPNILVVISLVVICGSLLGLSAQASPVPKTPSPVATHKSLVKKTLSHHVSKPPPPAPIEVPKPVPPPVKSPAPVSAPAPHPNTTRSLNPQPVVKPSPNSSVNTLVPVSPTTTPSSPTGPDPSPNTSTATTTGYTSTNWSGYMSNSGIFKSISGSWRATNPTGNGTSTSADGTWIGIGGVTTSDLIQIGTQNIVSPGGQVSSSAFYELLPNVSQTIPGVTVTPGDSMTASISEVTSGQWAVSITDLSNGQSYSNTLNYASTYSSAEWIEEDPSYSNNSQIPFDNFQSASFSGGSTTVNGVSKTIFLSNGQPITMVNDSGQPIAKPSVLSSGGNSFTVTP